MNVRIAAAGLMAFLALAACSSSTNGHPAKSNDASLPTSTGPAATTPTDTTSGAPTTAAGTNSGGGGGGGSDAAFCTKLQQAETKLSNLGASASDPSKLKDAITEEVAFFKDLENGAPSEVASAIHDLRTALEQVGVYFEHPSSNSTSALQALSTKLPADAQKIATYVTAHCG
jgi:hypothetical protein